MEKASHRFHRFNCIFIRRSDFRRFKNQEERQATDYTDYTDSTVLASADARGSPQMKNTKEEFRSTRENSEVR
jgi:hypothetical protein